MKALTNARNDRTLDHALTYALIELDNREYLKNSLYDPSPRVRRACLVALDQLGEKLDPRIVLEAMKSKDADLKETLVDRRPACGVGGPGGHRSFRATRGGDAGHRDALVAQLARLAKSPGIQKLLVATVEDPNTSDAARITALKAMSQAGLRPPPDSGYAALEVPLAPSTIRKWFSPALATLRALPTPKKPSEKLPQRLKALWGTPGSGPRCLGRLSGPHHRPEGNRNRPAPEWSAPGHARLSPRANGGHPVQANLHSDQLERLSRAPRSQPARTRSSSGDIHPDQGRGNWSQARRGPEHPELRPSLPADGVKERVKHFPPAVQKEAEKLYAVLNADYEQQKAQLDEIAKTLKPGDIRRGQAVFNSTKTSCIACHTVGYVGGKQGPDLTRIGGIRTERDLLESILFPSASFVRSYEPVIVRTKDSKTYSGVPKKDSPDEIMLVVAADKEVRIPREDIEEVRPGKVSIMPAGLDKQLTPQELADLIAFLKACK